MSCSLLCSLRPCASGTLTNGFSRTQHLRLLASTDLHRIQLVSLDVVAENGVLDFAPLAVDARHVWDLRHWLWMDSAAVTCPSALILICRMCCFTVDLGFRPESVRWTLHKKHMRIRHDFLYFRHPPRFTLRRMLVKEVSSFMQLLPEGMSSPFQISNTLSLPRWGVSEDEGCGT